MNGFLNINKPVGPTSRDVVDRIEPLFPNVRIGHAGTLDPLAGGVLVLCLGKATRLTEYVQRMKKTYAVTIRLGETSETDDAEGPIHAGANISAPSVEDLTAAAASFIGDIEQTPPAYSAARLEG